MLKLELLPEQPAKPGYGRLYLFGWLGQSLNVHITIQRIQDQYYLTEDGYWQKNQVVICLPELKKTINGDHWLTLGQHYVIPLLSDPLARYHIALSDGHHTVSSELIIANELRSLSSGNQFQHYANLSDNDMSKSNDSGVATIKLPTATSSKWHQQDSYETVVINQQKNLASKKGKRWSLMLLWNIFLLVVITSTSIGSLMLWMTPKENSVPGQNKTVLPSSTIPSACSANEMSSLGELDFIRSCLKSTNDSKIILDVITLAKMENHCGIAQRLYAYKAQSGDIAIALAYAKEYDFHETSSKSCFAADIEAARYWYEKVLNYDSQNTEAKARLAALKD